mgnify:CR=1 FL=1
MNKILCKIAERFLGIAKQDLTQLEASIAAILIKEDFLEIVDGVCVPKPYESGYEAAVQRANDENEGTWHHR